MRLLCLAALAALAASPALAGNCTDEKPCTLAEFRQAFTRPGTYALDVYVAGTLQCPPCLQGHRCEPCGDTLIIADEPDCWDKQCGNHMIIYEKIPKNAKKGEKILLRLQTIPTILTAERPPAVTLSPEDKAELSRNPAKWLQQNPLPKPAQ